MRGAFKYILYIGLGTALCSFHASTGGAQSIRVNANDLAQSLRNTFFRAHIEASDSALMGTHIILNGLEDTGSFQDNDDKVGCNNGSAYPYRQSEFHYTDGNSHYRHPISVRRYVRTYFNSNHVNVFPDIRQYEIEFGVSCWIVTDVTVSDDGFTISYKPAWVSETYPYKLINLNCGQAREDAGFVGCAPDLRKRVEWQNPKIDVHIIPIVYLDFISFEATSVQLRGRLDIDIPFTETECFWGAPCDVVPDNLLAFANNPYDEENIANTVLSSFNGGLKFYLAVWLRERLQVLTGQQVHPNPMSVRLENGELVIEQATQK